MLKSYEALYHNGHLHWLGMPPPREIEKRHVMVIVDLDKKVDSPTTDIRRILAQSRGCIKPLRAINDIDKDIVQMRSEWDREWDQ